MEKSSEIHLDKRQQDLHYVIIPDIISPQHDDNNKIFIQHKDKMFLHTRVQQAWEARTAFSTLRVLLLCHCDKLEMYELQEADRGQLPVNPPARSGGHVTQE